MSSACIDWILPILKQLAGLWHSSTLRLRAVAEVTMIVLYHVPFCFASFLLSAKCTIVHCEGPWVLESCLRSCLPSTLPMRLDAAPSLPPQF